MSYIICKKDLKSTRRGGQMVTFLVPPGFYGSHLGSTGVPLARVPPGSHLGSTGVFGRWIGLCQGGFGRYLVEVRYPVSYTHLTLPTILLV